MFSTVSGIATDMNPNRMVLSPCSLILKFGSPNKILHPLNLLLEDCCRNRLQSSRSDTCLTASSAVWTGIEESLTGKNSVCFAYRNHPGSLSIVYFHCSYRFMNLS